MIGSTVLVFSMVLTSGAEVKPGWLKGQFCVEPESFAQIRKELPEFPSDWRFYGTNEKQERNARISRMISQVHSNYRVQPSLDDLYRIIYLGEQELDAFNVAAEGNEPKIYEEVLKFDVLPSDLVKRLFFCCSRQNRNPFGNEFAKMMLSRFGHEDKVRAAYLGNMVYSGEITHLEFSKCLGIGVGLAKKYRQSDFLLPTTEDMVMYALTSKYLDLNMLSDIEKSFSLLESLRIELFGKLKPGTIYMKRLKDFAKKQRIRLENSGG